MATKFDLLNAVNESLTRSGKLNKLKAEMRAEVMKVLDSSSSVTKPEIPKETYLACELVRDFLLWNGFQYTASTLVAETGIPKEPMRRDTLNAELGVIDGKNTSDM
ncbi:unnamed protein product [Timema podura]|uniref:FGFR1 oncogene partner (FOP) N-terminal dimerisation domain-containing protein n=1 Tax=Timema podura TaxID=61482 RepID=A0ABN7NI98_TIMPD|nr:unnamed protein product [Timema podura]